MNKVKKKNYSIQSYIDSNKDKLDESLVSLRFMKVIDDFIIMNKINQKELASKLNYSNAYISQLMTGVKKINISFINKFEKTYDLKIDFKIKPNKTCQYFSKKLELNSFDSFISFLDFYDMDYTKEIKQNYHQLLKERFSDKIRMSYFNVDDAEYAEYVIVEDCEEK